MLYIVKKKIYIKKKSMKIEYLKFCNTIVVCVSINIAISLIREIKNINLVNFSEIQLDTSCLSKSLPLRLYHIHHTSH